MKTCRGWNFGPPVGDPVDFDDALVEVDPNPHHSARSDEWSEKSSLVLAFQYTRH